MKKHLVSAVTLALFLMGTAVPVVAQERVKPTDRPETEDRRDDNQERKEQKREELKERLSASRMERLKAWWNRTARRLGKIIEREDRIAEKIQERINKLKNRGRDVVQLQKDLDAAKVKIDAAKKALTDAMAQVDGILANNTPKEALRKLHELQKGVIAKIREAHSALVKVLASTRGLSVTPTPTPTVSPTPTPTS